MVLVSCSAFAAEDSPWSEISSDHFLVYFQGPGDYASETAARAEEYYRSLNADLGIDRSIHKEHLAFWLWENRCKIYLYPDRQSYLAGTNAPEWSGGMASSSDRVIISFVQSDTFLANVLPHEIAHVFFREYVGQSNKEVPRWLSEGVAEYAEFNRRKGVMARMRKAVLAGSYIPFTEFQTLQTKGLGAERAALFYDQALSVVDFFIGSYGSERFLILTDHLRDGYPFLRGLGAATYGRLDTLEKFEAEWVRYMTALAGAPPTTLASTEALPFTGEMLYGGELDLGDYLGKKVIVLNFWSTDCVSCVELMVHLAVQQKKYPDEIVMVGVDVDSFGKKRVQRFLEKQFPDLPEQYKIVVDKGREVARLYGVSVLPTTKVIGTDSKIKFHLVGFKAGDEKLIADAVRNALGK
jgi:thiol-disulfide isomerase/thioredoxin